MQVLQNEHFDLFDTRFIRFELNSLADTLSVVCFTPNSEADNNHQFVVAPIVRISTCITIKSIFLHV